MVVLFSVSACLSGGALLTQSDDHILGIFITHMCVQMCYIIMAPIIGVRMYEEM